MLSVIFVVSLATVGTNAQLLQVDCNQEAILVRLNKGFVQRLGYGMDDVHLKNHSCVLDHENGNFFQKRINPFLSCGTTYTTNFTHVVYKNEISTMSLFSGGVVVGSYARRRFLIKAMITCVYNIDLRASVMFVPNITFTNIPLPDAYGEGEFEVAMFLYTDDRYRNPYTEPPVFPPDAKFFAGVTIIGEASNDVFLLIESCWGTPFKDPERAPKYPLIADQCPISNAADGSVKITQNGVSHQAMWQSTVFKFVGPGLGQVWLHCDVRLCIYDTCEPKCESDRRRKRATLTRDKSQTVSVNISAFVFSRW